MATLYLVRHGETDWNVDGRFMGQTDVPLNERGRRQAASLALRLAQHVSEWGGVISSDLLRTRETRDILLAGANYTVTEDTRLREINGGRMEGLTRQEQRIQFPEWWLESREESSDAVRFPDGESFEDMRRRVVDALEEVCASGEGPVLVVTHGGVVQAVLSDILHLCWVYRDRIAVDNCSVTTVRWEADRRVILRVNA